MSAAFRTRRVYEPGSDGDGSRVLVDRLWPRGISKEKAGIDHWLKALAPSDALRRAFHDNPDGWENFRAAYAAELAAPEAAEAVAGLRRLAAAGPVTLLYAARDEQRNNAEALRLWLRGAD
ncbi:DUF488 domain-containing protein [Marinibaculum pumilum]|uniref:DUF488 domain-containing protein n=1 Tax=Marinibaculum pumilum TaxID=1766165 RepID=A0ABV7L0M3_9PROT